MRFSRPTIVCLWLQFVSSMDSLVCPTDNLQTLKLLVSLPFPNSEFPLFNPSWREGPNILPVMYLARDQINNRTDLLPCHELELMSVDGGCDISATTAVSTAVGLFSKEKSRVVGVIGPGCSAASLHTGLVLNQPEIELVHIHGGGSSLLANRSSYSNSLGILGSTQSFTELAVALVKMNNWHNIAILFESGRVYYTSAKNDFVQTLKDDSDEYNVTVLFESPVYSTFYPLDALRNSLSRVVFVFTALSHIRRILCLAYHNGLFYPAYQWVIFDHRLHEIANVSSSENIIFTYDQRMYNCTPSEILEFTLEAAFIMYHQLSLNVSVSDKRKLPNITFDEFLDLYQERADGYNISASIWAYSFYDAVWAWAWALHRLTIRIGGIFDDFEYGNETIASLILGQFYANDFEFEGMSGSVSFNSKSGFYDRPVNLYQIIGEKEVHIAYHNGTNTVSVEGTTAVMISDIVRADTSVSPILIAVFALLLFSWFFVLVALHVLTILYRDTKSVKASSPKLNHFAFIGTYFIVFGLLLFLFLHVREHPSYVSGPACHAVWVWILPIGFTLTIGTVTVRTWRLYRIFNHYLDPGRFISNTALTILLVILTSVDVIFAVIWTAVDPRTLMITTDTTKNGPATELVIIRTCRSQYDGVWVVLSVAYKASLLVAMVVLTILTRHISNKSFTTASLQVFSYIFSAVFGTGFALYFFFLYFASTRFRLDANFNSTVLHVTANIMLFLFVTCLLGPPLLPVVRGKTCTVKLIRQLSKISTKRQKKLFREPVDSRGSDAAVKARNTSADALLSNVQYKQ